MPHQVPAEEKKRRAAELASIQAGIKAGILDGIVRSGRTLNVLCETGGSGHSDEFIEIKAENARGKDVRGKVFGFRPLYSDGDVLHGDLLF